MSSNPRLIRLQNDYKKMCSISAPGGIVEIVHTTGNPPEKYTVCLRCCGISRLNGLGQPVFTNKHDLSVFLPPEYPRKAPVFNMLTPVWHPNIGYPENGTGGFVCIGDTGDHGYAPSMGLDDLVLRIVQMICYENYGLRSVVNVYAANWTADHLYLFPLK